MATDPISRLSVRVGRGPSGVNTQGEDLQFNGLADVPVVPDMRPKADLVDSIIAGRVLDFFSSLLVSSSDGLPLSSENGTCDDGTCDHCSCVYEKCYCMREDAGEQRSWQTICFCHRHALT